MRAEVQRAAVVWTVCLFGAASVAQEQAGKRSVPVQDVVRAEESALQLQELTVAFQRLMSDYAELKTELAEKDQAIKTLSESLAAAQAEAAQLRQQQAQRASATAAPAPADPAKLQQQLAEAAQALRKSEADRAQLVEQLARLNGVLELALRGTGGMSVTQRAQALAEAERVKRMLSGVKPPAAEPAPGTNTVAAPQAQPGPPTLENGRIVSLNWELRLAVINLGEEHGVRLGMPFRVIRGDRVIGYLRVVELRRKISGAVIETMDRDIAIQVNDRVRWTSG
ncbi:MAG: hypothetical protein N2689_08365 [Verrucomicrobiae bacterium]|nr:hypothetical protein [Verrucomicrobiae bacterium]